MAGIGSSTVRSSFNEETTPGTIKATPSWKIMHVGPQFTGQVERYHTPSLVGTGSLMGDALLNKTAVGSIPDHPMVYTALDPIMETLMQSTWSANAMSNGMASTSLSFEDTIPIGIGGALRYKRYVGVEAISGIIKGDAEGLITQSFELLGMNSNDTSSAIITGATYTNPSNIDPFSAQTDFGTFTAAGYTLDPTAGFQIDMAYGGVGGSVREGQPKMGGDGLVGITRGGFQPKITAKFYVDTNFQAFHDAVRSSAQTSFKVTLNFGSVTAKKYRYEFWSCIADMAPLDFSSATGYMSVTFTALHNTAQGCVLTITRAVA